MRRTESPVVYPGDTVLALFRVERKGNKLKFRQAMGTGFLVAPGVLVTCWHCVPAPAEHSYAALRLTGDHPQAYELTDVEQDEGGSDLAIARIDYYPDLWLRVTDGEIDMNSDVAAYGYPLTTPVPWIDEPGFELQPRFLRGYVTRIFTRVDETFGLALSYELDMLAPTGISGAPLLSTPSSLGPQAIVGVVYGVHESYSIAEEGRVDPETGESRAEVRRIVSFALAHHNMMLCRLAGKATDGKSLRDYLAERSLLQHLDG